MDSSHHLVSRLGSFFVRVPYWNQKRNPNLENCPYDLRNTQELRDLCTHRVGPLNKLKACPKL